MRPFFLIFAFAVPVAALVMLAAADGGRVELAANGVVFASLILTWIGAVVVRAKLGLEGTWAVVSLGLLVLFGFLVGWLYVAVRAWSLPQRKRGRA